MRYRCDGRPVLLVEEEDAMKKRAYISLISILVFSFIISITPTVAHAGNLEKLKVSSNGRHLETISGTPFFWIGDTGWQITVDLTREDVDFYFDNRKAKGFTVARLS